MKKAEAIIKANEAVEGYNTVTGFSLVTGAYSSNQGFFFIQLKEWAHRTTAEAHAQRRRGRSQPGLRPADPRGDGGGVRPAGDPGPRAPAPASRCSSRTAAAARRSSWPSRPQRFIEAARKRPEIGRVSTLYRASVPQVYADIDRSKVLKVGVTIGDVNTTLGALLGSSYVNDFNRFGRVYKVYVQAEPEFRRDPKQLGLFFVRSAKGEMVPLDTLISTRSTSGPEFTNRFNLYRSAEISGVPAPGYSSAQALTALEETAKEVLPPEMGYEWADMSYQEKNAPGVAVVFAVAILLVFLILAAQYESWALPFSVLLGTPFAVFGAYFGLWVARQFSESYVNNVFAQIALIMLIGLAAKNAILIVEFAKMLHEQGKGLVEAALEAAKLRFRPILMTAFAFILGVTPLLTASGAGAEARKVMGMAVFAGMLIATILGVCLVPVLFVTVEKVIGRGQARGASGGARHPPKLTGEGTDMTRLGLLRRSSLVALALVAALASGCAVGPNYSRPEMPAPPQYRFVEGPAEAETIADVPWWSITKDPQLQALLREAIAHNLDLRVATARVAEARAQYGIARSFLFPEVNVAGGYSAQQVSRLSEPPQGTAAAKTYQNWSAGFPLSWEIDLFGRLRRGKEAAFAAYLATEQGQRAALVTLVADVASTYLLLRQLDLQLEISRRTVATNDETVRFYEARLKGGVSNRLEVDQAVGNRARTATVIPQLERQISVTENALCLLLGRLPGPIERGAPLAEEQVPPAIPAGLPASLLERRPDVLGAEQLLVAANANVGAAKALFFPTISLTGLLGTISGDFSNLLKADSNVWQLSPSLFTPIFQGGRIRRNYEASKARYDQALAAYQKAALNGYREVADALVSVQKLGEARLELEDGVDALRDAGTAGPLPLRQRALQLPRDPDRRPVPVRPGAGARAGSRRRDARVRRSLPRARRRLAAGAAKRTDDDTLSRREPG